MDSEEPVCFRTWQLLCVLHTRMQTCSAPDPQGYSCPQPGPSLGTLSPAFPGGSYLQGEIKGMAGNPGSGG